MRLALPRRVYTQSHYEYVAEVLTGIAKHRDSVPGYHIVHSTPLLRHFNSTMKPVPPHCAPAKDETGRALRNLGYRHPLSRFFSRG